LVVAGPKPDSASPEAAGFHHNLELLADRSGTRDRTHFLGFVSDVAALMRAADIFVFPSRREGMPNVVLEAMASGLPVVMTPFEGFSNDFGRPGREFVLTDFNIRHLVADVDSLLRDTDRRHEIAKAARAWATTRLDLRMSIEAYVTLYREICRGRKT
jgi:glycosyltransferase involved in cell wall biosynthesis